MTSLSQAAPCCQWQWFPWQKIVVYEPTDVDLIEQARRLGDKAAIDILLERHQAAALRLARRMIAHEEVARELVQEAMLQAYLCLDALAQPARFSSWLMGIVINVCRNYLRQRHLNPLSLEALAGGLEATPALLVSHAPDAHTIAEMRELHELVLAALATLSPANRDAVMLFYYEQLSLREISLTLGISMAAVKGRLHKARRQLATYFATFVDLDLWLPAPRSPATVFTVQEGHPTMTEVEIVDVVVLEEDQQGHYIIILLDKIGQRILPIWIGPFEGQSIAMYLLQDTLVPRPLTFDFMASLVKASGASLEEVRISGLHASTYYATAMLRVGGTVHEIDARPSDAMALALRVQCKLFVDEEIMAVASRAIPEKYQGNLPRKGLDQMVAQMEKAKREYEEEMAKFMARRAQEKAGNVTDRLFAYVFGE